MGKGQLNHDGKRTSTSELRVACANSHTVEGGAEPRPPRLLESANGARFVSNDRSADVPRASLTTLSRRRTQSRRMVRYRPARRRGHDAWYVTDQHDDAITDAWYVTDQHDDATTTRGALPIRGTYPGCDRRGGAALPTSNGSRAGARRRRTARPRRRRAARPRRSMAQSSSGSSRSGSSRTRSSRG